MRSKNLLWFHVLLLIVLSCKKSSSPDEENPIDEEPCIGCQECSADEGSRINCKVVEFLYSGTLDEDITPDRHLITYNAQGQIEKIERFDEEGLTETINYTYRSNEILVERVLGGDFVLGTESYTLNNKGLITSFPLRNNNNIRVQVTYNNEDQLIRLEADPDATSYNLSEIAYDGDNISSIKVTSDASQHYVDVTLTYDLNKTAPAFQSMRIFGLNTLFGDIALQKNALYEMGYFGKRMKNAVTHSLRTYSTGGTYESPFTYYCNSNGYIFRMQMGNTLTHTYTYECED